MKVATIIADIVKSKEIMDRFVFQNNLKNKLITLNESSTSILSPYTITLGDEFQAVYKDTDGIFFDLLGIMIDLYPVKIRIAIGIDEIVTDINKKSSIGMDGPAFHIARNGLNNIKAFDATIIQIYDSKNDVDLEFINRGLALVMSEINDWKKNTLLTFYNMLDKKTVIEIFPKLDISQRGVYKLINTNNIDYYVDFFESLNDKINDRYSLR